MAKDQLKAFLAAVQTDTSLSNNLKAAPDVDAVVAVARDAGYELSADRLKGSLNHVSEEALEAGVGRFTAVSCPKTEWKSSCEGTITY